MNFTIDQEAVIGNEDDSSVNLEIVSVTGIDTDTDPSDNTQQVGFSINAIADISVGDL